MATRIGIWNGRAGHGFSGTPSCLLGDPQTGSLLLLASRHVVAPFHLGDGSYLTDTIYCERVDGDTPQSVPAGEVVTYTNFAVNPSSIWTMDAALIRIRADYRQWVLDAFKAAGLPAGIDTVAEREPVSMVGRFSQRSGTVVHLDVVRALDYAIDLAGNRRMTQFNGLVVTNPMSVPGDSGAPLLNSAGRVVGFLGGGDLKTESVFFKAQVALDAFRDYGLRIVTRHDAPFPVAPAGVPAQPGPPARIPPAGSPVDILARTLWGEARGESPDGLRGVAAVVLNRANRRPPWWWGSSVEEVCTKPFQFSCWNLADANRAKLLAVTTSDAAFRDCMLIAHEAIADGLEDRTAGATHYHHASMVPVWAVGRTPCIEIGRHRFYNDIEPLPA